MQMVGCHFEELLLLTTVSQRIYVEPKVIGTTLEGIQKGKSMISGGGGGG